MSDGGAGLDELGPELEARARAVRRPRRNLTRDREIDCVGDRLDDVAGEHGILEQRGARPGPRHLPHGAAEVEVDDVGTDRLDHLRRVRERARLRAEELDRERMLVRSNPEVPERPLVAVLDPRAAHHLGAHEPSAVAAALPSERLHADARHRGENEPRRDLDGADVPGRAKVDHRTAYGCVRRRR